MPRPQAAALVTGCLVIGAATPAFRGATAHVRLEDVSFADADAVVVAEAVIPGVTHDPTRAGARGTIVPFALHPMSGAAAVSVGNDYAVRAWVDRDSDGTEGPDDLFSDQSYPVLTRGFGSVVIIGLGS